jgi:hypothetical protein
MWQRLVIGFLLAVAAYFVVQYFSSHEPYTNWDSRVETPATAPLIRQLPVRGDLNVAASGPNPPNTAAPRGAIPTISPSPEASDPMIETAEDADAPERLRHPERSFGPGVVPEQIAIAQAGGLAGAPVSSPQALQQFSPDFVQNGGAFFGTVSALEDENPNYSAF